MMALKPLGAMDPLKLMKFICVYPKLYIKLMLRVHRLFEILSMNHPEFCGSRENSLCSKIYFELGS